VLRGKQVARARIVDHAPELAQAVADQLVQVRNGSLKFERQAVPTLPQPERIVETVAMNETVCSSDVAAFFDLPVQRHDVGGWTLAYRDVAPESTTSGSPPRTVLCVHGNPTWSFYYRRVIERFAGRFRIIAVDHVGCGESDKPDRSDFGYTLADHTANLVSLIEQLDLQAVTLLAHDWGGAIGLGAAARCQQRFNGLMLLNTAAFPPPYIPLRIAACRTPLLGTAAVRGLNLFARAAITMAMNRNRMASDVAAGLLRPYDSWKHRVAIDAFVRDIPMTKRHPTHQTLVALEKRLPSLADLPSLLVWGMQDWCFRPECLRRFQALWPNARSVEIADAGHYVLEDAPDETLDAIESFLNSDGSDS
jgi:haloalkane dehalogenase